MSNSSLTLNPTKPNENDTNRNQLQERREKSEGRQEEKSE